LISNSRQSYLYYVCVFLGEDHLNHSTIRHFNLDKLCWVIGLSVLVRLIFLGLLDLLPEEAYYWNYAQHLDIGYLDHPPMVAWLIGASEALLGRSEFAVRLPAFLGWIVLAYFVFHLAEDTIGKGTGRMVILLLAILPIYMSVGFLMTPDAPFYVCWAGALFFIARAMFNKRPLAWYGAGIFLGLGMLSKYTMGLIVPATLAYMLVDKDARQWFKRPHPYIALLLGLVLFLPVLYWNSQHQWASFAFQGTRRWGGDTGFHLHILIGSILVLITPLGLYEAARVILDFQKCRRTIRQADLLRYRKYLFLVTFTLVPLLVFVIHSIQGQPKLNWTGPAWLALLPLIGARISGMRARQDAPYVRTLTRRWLVTASLVPVLFAAGFGYMIAGMPGFTKESWMKLPIAWKAYGDRVEEIETRLENETDSEPIVIGLDEYWLASQASFYDPDDDDDLDTLQEIAGENLVGGNSLMWNSWVSPQMVAGRHGLLVSFTEDKLKQNRVTGRFSKVGEISKEVLTNCDGEIGHFYWRVGYNYRADSLRRQ
jgi:dolichol-phosphate mannosyltransferase